MEGGLDVEAHAAQEEQPKQAGGEAETDEGNKFQKAIGAWRSMTTQCLCHSRELIELQTSISLLSFHNSTP
jgi:hypothetical protein